MIALLPRVRIAQSKRLAAIGACVCCRTRPGESWGQVLKGKFDRHELPPVSSAPQWVPLDRPHAPGAAGGPADQATAEEGARNSHFKT